jgi:(p)ppGpp synthase/HD superfamily hydrolase
MPYNYVVVEKAIRLARKNAQPHQQVARKALEDAVALYDATLDAPEWEYQKLMRKAGLKALMALLYSVGEGHVDYTHIRNSLEAK